MRFVPVLVLLVAGVVGAQEITESAQSKLADLAFLNGQWSCNGKFIKSGKTIEATVSFEPVLGGTWIVMRHEDHPPFNYHAISEWGWDARRHKYISTIQDSSGVERRFVSEGLISSRLLWIATGTSGSPGDEEFQYDTAGDSVFDVSYLRRISGKWVTVDKSRCERIKPNGGNPVSAPQEHPN